MNINIVEKDLLMKKIVFVDGLTRVGKSMYNRIIASLENVSHPMFFESLEQLLPIYKVNKIDREAFSSFIRLNLNERAYNYHLSRNLNFRYDDLSSIYNSNNPKQFLKNLSKIDGDNIIKELELDKTIYQFLTHNKLTQYSLFLDLNMEAKIIEVFRNPIDTIYSWYIRGWGRRFDNEDPRSFTTLFKYKAKTIPHYVIGYEEEYLKLNEMEKCVFMHNILLEKSILEYKSLLSEQKENILLLKYEDMLLNTDIEIEKICNFLNVTRTINTPKAMLEARVPRNIDVNQTSVKLKEIKKNINIDLFKELIEFVARYEDNFYNLQ